MQIWGKFRIRMQISCLGQSCDKFRIYMQISYWETVKGKLKYTSNYLIMVTNTPTMIFNQFTNNFYW